ncbi:outer membrane protein MIP [Steroidobacter agaridevorans]|uniref:Peptidyl-prolyl cis-trans isomerase n=1 Tax=Steroidobacter agaridevorans TaxID=2695856 RepID=A0A829YB77_9GAMM|nr:FKBP-type peptidyl-prolyl cis-trans isomerase [Steroidobacter agaridevorans]GFE80624.1 outer membrane protein MIP [Steroidobacter agaridevorans]
MKKNKGAAVLMSIAVCMAACNPQSPSEEKAAAAQESQQDFKTLEDRYSYAYGANLAEQFRAEGIAMNVDLMAAAMQAVFAGSEKRMSAGEIAATIQLYQEAHAKQKEAEWAVATEENKRAGEIFLRENAGKEGVIVTKSGLQYKVIAKGSGGYTPTVEDDVKVHYRGRLIDGAEFDSTYSRGEPYSTNAKALIEGWAEALQLMSEGAKWELYVPANLAYGEAGSPPYVGPDAVLIFEVELLEVDKRQ